MSTYYKHLFAVDKLRYEEKLNLLGFSLDWEPYIINKYWIDDVSQWPNLQYGHLYTYLIDSPGPFTRKSLRCFRSLEAYTLFESGWVHTCLIRYNSSQTKCIIKAKVYRSQAVTEKPHEAWVGLDKSGRVECAHCTCMAGLGEVCSHVAGILFKVEACVRFEYNKVSCTSMPCSWNQTFTKKVEPAMVADINFSKVKKVHLAPCLAQRQPVKFADSSSLLVKLRKSVPSAAILTITNPVITDWSQEEHAQLPSPLSLLFDEKYKHLTEAELKCKCENVFSDELKITQQEATVLEKETICQSGSATGFEYRIGRLTASNFGSIYHCQCKPSQVSLLKKIMQYDQTTDSDSNKHDQARVYAPCEWGLDHENDALDQYKTIMMSGHTNLVLQKSGFVINPDFPHLGATPDSYVTCDCCGKGLVDVKCLFKYRDQHPCEICDNQFYLKPHVKYDPVCINSLQTSHNYYHQVQGQLHVCDLNYCDFVVWSRKGIHIERVIKDTTFWNSLKVKLDFYFLRIVLPELLTRAHDHKMNHAHPVSRERRRCIMYE
ncbi:uncharacterized protein [Haliotis cracherodii]|uniref:uncharacterized protein n=1 Tax=Haliotis cracherodii TaxID=6455 RepID=UPI0039ED19E2